MAAKTTIGTSCSPAPAQHSGIEAKWGRLSNYSSLICLSAIWKCLYFAGDRGQLLGNALQERLLSSSPFSLGTA
ncbi:MAG TPA: hypothetical protein VFQ43_08745, partial [Nitrososphaera sp.]|nr:hypothetical protein [Nitrososphaera sp.]